MSDIIDGIPAVNGDEKECGRQPKAAKPLYAPISSVDYPHVQSAFGVALHMHQPTIPASSGDLRNAELISNLQYMMEHQDSGDNHNAPVFMWCYWRMSEIIPELVGQGKHPRIMLDYSGNLLWGLRQMEGGNTLERLKRIACDPEYYQYVEWLGTMWAHAVAASTPVPDLKLHMLAWRAHFAAIFGREALARVKGFSPPEMSLPIHPDVCYEYVKALKECGYEWLMAQEHTIENLDGTGIRRPHFPHRLVAKNSLGEVEEIAVLVKTQGSDTKLVAQMQPCYEAKSRGREELGGKSIPPFVLQIGDGENGGVMMNEFPPGYKLAYQDIGRAGTVGMNGSEYLEFIKKAGVDEKSFIPVQPISQNRIWNAFGKFEPHAADKAIEKIHAQDQHYNLDKGSWTNDRSWVKGYESVLNPIFKLSAAFHQKFDGKKVDTKSLKYRRALLHLLVAESSDFRYWGSGAWTDYAAEICRRGMEALK